jgi:hypothetical protein
MEACLITGAPEIGSVAVSISSLETFQAMPTGMVAILRVNGAGLIPKTTLWDLDAAMPGWQSANNLTTQPLTQFSQPVAAGAGVTALVVSATGINVGQQIAVGAGADLELVTVTAVGYGSFTATFANAHAAGEPVFGAVTNSPTFWFPFGMTGFGIYPQMVGGASVVITGIMQPVTDNPPWDGTHPVPYGAEFYELFQDYSAHILRLKESGAEFKDSIVQYQRALNRAGELSRFSIRTNSLRFSRQAGAPTATSPVEVK